MGMFRYELKKVFSRKGSKIVLFLMVFVLVVISYFSVNEVSYVNEQGKSENGVRAARKLRSAQKEWAGYLTEEKLEKVIEENNRINASKEAQSDDVVQNNIAYGRKQGFYNIRSLLAYAFSGFLEYDYYKPDSLTPKDAEEFYPRRIENLKEYLDNDGKYDFTEKEKEYLISRYEELETPLYCDYMEGWRQVFQYSYAIIAFAVLLAGVLVAGIFSCESQWKADAVFYASYYGRTKAVSAKIKAGFCIVTAVYWIMMGLYSAIVLGLLGADGANCAIQASMYGWKSYWNITNLQGFLLILIGGYVGSLFILSLTMLAAAKTKSSVAAVLVPFVMIFVPEFLGGIESRAVQKVVGLLPDQLLKTRMLWGYFNMYEIGGKIVEPQNLILVLYGVLAIVTIPVLYQVYRKAEMKS